MIDSMDLVAVLQQGGQEKEEGDTTKRVSIRQRAEEILLAAIRKRKQ